MIYIEVIKVKWNPAKNLLKDAKRKEVREFEAYIANKYVELVKDRVFRQKFIHKWKPLSGKYLLYKKKNNLSLKTWEATSQLIFEELKVKKNNVVGFDNRKKHRRTKQKLLEIARCNEYGTFRIPARPLFRLVYWYMKKNISFFYKQYLKERGRA